MPRNADSPEAITWLEEQFEAEMARIEACAAAESAHRSPAAQSQDPFAGGSGWWDFAQRASPPPEAVAGFEPPAQDGCSIR